MMDSAQRRLEATTISQIRSELEQHWETFAAGENAPVLLRPEIIESWERCRDEYRIDLAMQRSQVLLSPDQLEKERFEDEVLQISRPYLDELKEVLRDTGHVLTYFNAGCSMLESAGDAKVRECLEEINFSPGGNWSEQLVGTNGPGTALARKTPIRVLASEHYVEAWHEWACYAVPILDPITQEAVAVLDATGCRDTVYPGMLALLRTVARAIERDLQSVQLRKDFSVLDKYADAASGRSASALLAVDSRGRILKAHPSAMRILRLPRMPKSLADIPEMRSLLLSLQTETQKTGKGLVERNVDLPDSGKHFTTAAIPVLLDRRFAGAVVLLDDRSAAAKPVRSGQVAAKTGTRYSFDSILGQSAGLQRAFSRAHQASLHDMPVLITGESGTGKEMFAQAIHTASQRADGPFVAVNCGSIPRELLESELFGYVAGAFTGAKQGGNAGKFEQACGGTIFLDEVSELSLSGQVALLRVLQEMEIVRVGSSTPIPIDLRVVAASNKGLFEQTNLGLFRRDLFYRLNVFAVDLPPLRAREEDVVLLAQKLLEELSLPVRRSGLTFSSEVLTAFRRYPWPGNVRELRNLVQRAVVLCPGEQITLADLAEIEPAIAAGCEPVPAPFDMQPKELDSILQTVNECGGNVSAAARRLGLSRMTIYRKLQQQNSLRRALP